MRKEINCIFVGQGGTETKPILGEIVSLRNKGVIAAKGGVHHSLVLTNRNELYSFGRGDSGQLGRSENKIILYFHVDIFTIMCFL